MPTVSKTSHRCFHSIPQIKNLFSGCLVKIHVEKHLYVDFTFGLYLSWELVELVPMQICKLEVEPTTLDYSVWYSNLTEKTKKKIKIIQKKCIRFCLRLEGIHHICQEDFKSINWLSTTKRVNQCIKIITLKFINNICHYYLKETFAFAPYCRIDARNNTAKYTVILPNFLVLKFCGKAQFSHIAQNYAETVTFHKIFTPGN